MNRNDMSIDEYIAAAWQEEADRIHRLFVKKQHDYGPLNIGFLGVQGVFVRMFDKVLRLKTLVWDNREPQVDETVEDTLMDIADYAIIGLLLLRGEWPRISFADWKGENDS